MTCYETALPVISSLICSFPPQWHQCGLWDINNSGARCADGPLVTGFVTRLFYIYSFYSLFTMFHTTLHA